MALMRAMSDGGDEDDNAHDDACRFVEYDQVSLTQHEKQ
jgi:hypothetical protein